MSCKLNHLAAAEDILEFEVRDDEHEKLRGKDSQFHLVFSSFLSRVGLVVFNEGG